jgi:hypothetical protein
MRPRARLAGCLPAERRERRVMTTLLTDLAE